MEDLGRGGYHWHGGTTNHEGGLSTVRKIVKPAAVPAGDAARSLTTNKLTGWLSDRYIALTNDERSRFTRSWSELSRTSRASCCCWISFCIRAISIIIVVPVWIYHQRCNCYPDQDIEEAHSERIERVPQAIPACLYLEGSIWLVEKLFELACPLLALDESIDLLKCSRQFYEESSCREIGKHTR